MINSLLIFAILVWPFGQLLPLTLWGSSFRVQLLDVVLALLSVSLILNSKTRRLLKTDSLSKPLFFFGSAALFSLLVATIVHPPVNVSAWAYFLRFLFYSSVYFAFRLEGEKKFRPYLFVSAFIFLVLGFGQYLYLPDVRFLRYLGFDDHYYRLIGSFFDPNYTGLVLVILTLLALSRRGLGKSYAFLPFLGLVLTFSRASFLTLAAALVYLSLVRKRFLLLGGLIVLVIALYLVPKPFGEGVNLWRTFSVTSRLQNQLVAGNLFLKNPLFGVGFNTLKTDTQSLVANLSGGVDNSYLFVLATTGLLGFTAFIYLLMRAWCLATNDFQKACLLAILVHSLFNNSFFYSWILVVFYLLLNLKIKKST